MSHLSLSNRSARTPACRVHTRVNASLCSQECEHGTHECVRYIVPIAKLTHCPNKPWRSDACAQSTKDTTSQSGPPTHSRTASALRSSGTEQIHALARIRPDTSTKSLSATHAAPTPDYRNALPRPAVFRDASSITTRLMVTGSAKSATCGSLKAMWPFSPKPTNARSMRRFIEQRWCSAQSRRPDPAHRPACIASSAGCTFVLDAPLEPKPEAGWMRVRHADIFVEVKHFDGPPRHVWDFHQRVDQARVANCRWRR